MVRIEYELYTYLSNRNEVAFAALVKTITPDTFPYVQKIVKDKLTAEEVIYDVIYGLWMSWKEKYNRVNNPAAFIKMIFINRAKNIIRRRKVVRKYMQHLGFLASPHVETAICHVEVEKKDRAALLLQLSAKMSGPRKEVFILIATQGWTVKEVAAHMSISESTVNWHLRNAKYSMFQYMQKYDNTGLFVIFVLAASSALASCLYLT